MFFFFYYFALYPVALIAAHISSFDGTARLQTTVFFFKTHFRLAAQPSEFLYSCGAVHAGHSFNFNGVGFIAFLLYRIKPKVRLLKQGRAIKEVPLCFFPEEEAREPGLCGFLLWCQCCL